MWPPILSTARSRAVIRWRLAPPSVGRAKTRPQPVWHCSGSHAACGSYRRACFTRRQSVLRAVAAFLLLRTDQNGVTQSRYTKAPTDWGPLFSGSDSGSSLFYACDAGGSTRLLVNPDGSPFYGQDYTAWGQVPVGYLYGSLIVAPYLPAAYRGQYGYFYDIPGSGLDNGTGRIYVRARHYDPSALLRWLSPDPLGLAGGDGNLYRYVGNRPTVRVDPSGLFSLIDLLVPIGGTDLLAASAPAAAPKPVPFPAYPASVPKCGCTCTASKTGSAAVVTDLTLAGQPLPPGTCPKSPDELTTIGYICLADRAKTTLPSIPGAPYGAWQGGMNQAQTTCCTKQSSKTTWYWTGCTSFRFDFAGVPGKVPGLPGVYQQCLWEHELRRRWACYWSGDHQLTYDKYGNEVSPEQDHRETLRCVYETLRNSCVVTDPTVLRYCNPDR